MRMNPIIPKASGRKPAGRRLASVSPDCGNIVPGLPRLPSKGTISKKRNGQPEDTWNRASVEPRRSEPQLVEHLSAKKPLLCTVGSATYHCPCRVGNAGAVDPNFISGLRAKLPPRVRWGQHQCYWADPNVSRRARRGRIGARTSDELGAFGAVASGSERIGTIGVRPRLRAPGHRDHRDQGGEDEAEGRPHWSWVIGSQFLD